MSPLNKKNALKIPNLWEFHNNYILKNVSNIEKCRLSTGFKCLDKGVLRICQKNIWLDTFSHWIWWLNLNQSLSLWGLHSLWQNVDYCHQESCSGILSLMNSSHLTNYMTQFLIQTYYKETCNMMKLILFSFRISRSFQMFWSQWKWNTVN